MTTASKVQGGRRQRALTAPLPAQPPAVGSPSTANVSRSAATPIATGRSPHSHASTRTHDSTPPTPPARAQDAESPSRSPVHAAAARSAVRPSTP